VKYLDYHRFVIYSYIFHEHDWAHISLKGSRIQSQIQTEAKEELSLADNLSSSTDAKDRKQS
jgi:hypothetical protein